MTAIDASGEQRAALARELQWLAGILPLGNETDFFTHVADDRVAAIVATALLGLPSRAADEAISRALAAVGLQRGVDRAFYYALDDTAGTLALTHEWHAPHLRAMKPVPRFAQMPLDVLPPPFLANLRRGGVIRMPRTHQFLGTAVETLVAPDGDRALLLMPVVVDGALIGVAGFAAAVGSTWEQDDQDLLQLVAQGVARAVERKRVDDALHAAEERFRAMCDASPLGIFLAGPSGECLYLNRGGETIMGQPLGEALGRGWMNSLHPEDRERVVARWGSAVQDRSAYKTPIHRFVHKNGEVRSVEVRALPITGQPQGVNFVGILEDVTERLKSEKERQDLLARTEAARVEAEAARQEAEAARADVAAILSRISDAFIALDREGRFTYANDRALALCGHARADIIGEVAWVVNPQFEGTLKRAFEQAVAEQRAITVETQCCGRLSEVRLYPSQTGVSFFFEDISDRKRHEEQLTSDREYLRKELGGLDVESDIVGGSPAIRHMMERVALVAGTNTTVLLNGETGTGKELVARAIHEASSRRERLLVKVNCAAISAGLVESELFGHEKGAFTGAVGKHKGRFELAHGGTLFLDEIGEIPVEMQVKLLRVLQESEFERVGGIKTIKVDVRLVTATNRDLLQDIAAGSFREDLYYRLNVVPIHIPPLRERREDIPLLVDHFLAKFNDRLKKQIGSVSADAVSRLVSYHWPGNIRELENLMERTMLFCEHPESQVSDLPPEIGGLPAAALPLPGAASLKEAVRAETERVERELIQKALDETGGNVTQAARKLKISRKSLQTKMKELGLRTT